MIYTFMTHLRRLAPASVPIRRPRHLGPNMAFAPERRAPGEFGDMKGITQVGREKISVEFDRIGQNYIVVDIDAWYSARY